MNKKKKDAAQLGKVNSTGSRLLGPAASMPSNKSALPDRTPAGMQGVRITGRKQKAGELLGGDAEDVFGGPQVSSK